MKKAPVDTQLARPTATVNVLIFGYKEFSQLMSSILPQFSDRARFKIFDAIVGSVEEIRSHIDEFHPDVIVSAGSNAAYLSSALTMPVESLQVTENDLVSAISRASRVSDNIVLINFHGPSACVPLLRETLGVKITEHNYRTADEAREWFHVHRNDPDVVFVGASLICGLAAQHQIPSFLQYSVDSCEKTLRRALQIAEAHKHRREEQALTQWLLKDSKTPIIMVDASDNRVTFNHAAKTQLHLSSNYLNDLASFLDRINADRQSDGECEINQLAWWYHQDDVYINQRHCFVYQFYPKKVAKPQGRKPATDNHRLVYQSQVMSTLMSYIQAYAISPSNVLIFGESGTGKELIARAIHSSSPYSKGEFVALNCSAIPTELFEGELFGHVEGAYTGSRRGGRKGLVEEAEGGVLFLDEISELALDQQAKLLRFLQERRFRPLGGNQEQNANIKLVAASNKPLKQLVDDQQFREDLFFRLNVFNVNVPPLRERQDDMLLIAEHKLGNLAAQYGLSFSPTDMLEPVADILCAYRWPGNIRELENVLERIAAWLYASQDLQGLPRAFPQIAQELFIRPEAANDGPNEPIIKHAEENLILSAMQRFNGNKKQVAEYLGMSQTTLWRRLKALENTKHQPGEIPHGNTFK